MNDDARTLLRQLDWMRRCLASAYKIAPDAYWRGVFMALLQGIRRGHPKLKRIYKEAQRVES